MSSYDSYDDIYPIQDYNHTNNREDDESTITRSHSHSDTFSDDGSINIRSIPSPELKTSPCRFMHVCGICMNSTEKSQVIILNCSHMFHTKCLSKIHYNLYNMNRTKWEDFIDTLKCFTCGAKMDMADIMYIHSKSIITNTKLLSEQEAHIKLLTEQYTKIKEELDVSYSYKYKLDYEYNISKCICTSCSNTILQ